MPVPQTLTKLPSLIAQTSDGTVPVKSWLLSVESKRQKDNGEKSSPTDKQNANPKKGIHRFRRTQI
jgi:hypothetical protein